MTHIILENCIKCKFTDCVNVCPVDCFFEGINFLVINTKKCIDCAICVNECPIEAIISYDIIDNTYYNLYYKLNLELSNIWPNINKSKNNLLNNERWKNIKNKLHLIKI